ncbi:MAG: GAF domain-containing protein [Candidatus Krumholzibacteria bacterium]|nr:GAF domain-containing protein [Candidatus Krumholzibacteria bacterium]
MQVSQKTPNTGNRADHHLAPISTADLEHRDRHSWLVLGVTLVITTIGLTATTLFVTWPWQWAEVARLVFLCLMVFLLAGYLTRQRRLVDDIRHKIEHLERNAAERRYSRLFDLLDVSRIMVSEQEAHNVFDAVTQACLEIFDCDKASLMLVVDGRYLEVKSAFGYMNPKIIGARQKMGEGIAGWVAKNRRPALIQGRVQPGKYPGLSFKSRGVPAAVVVPIIVKDELVGVLNISTRSTQTIYDGEDERAIQAFADNVGACVQAGMTTRRMRDTIQEQQRELQKMYVTTS